MTISPDQEMAYRLTELYLKHIINSRDRKDLSIDDVIEKYHYVLDEIKSKNNFVDPEIIQENLSLLPGIPETPIQYEETSDPLSEIKEEDDNISASDILL